jgi:TolA-binding protein
MTIMSLTVGQIAGYLACIAAALSVFFEITPVKINPVTSLLHWIGKRINSPVLTRLSDVESQITALESQITTLNYDLRKLRGNIDEQEAINCRIRILQFADDLRLNKRHSKDRYDQIISDIDTYEKYCKSNVDFKNNKTGTADRLILDCYAQCMENNDFL